MRHIPSDNFDGSELTEDSGVLFAELPACSTEKPNPRITHFLQGILVCLAEDLNDIAHLDPPPTAADKHQFMSECNELWDGMLKSLEEN